MTLAEALTLAAGPTVTMIVWAIGHHLTRERA